MAKMRIEIRKPDYAGSKTKVLPEVSRKTAAGTPFIFQLLLLGTYACSAVALWFVFQRFRAI